MISCQFHQTVCCVPNLLFVGVHLFYVLKECKVQRSKNCLKVLVGRNLSQTLYRWPDRNYTYTGIPNTLNTIIKPSIGKIMDFLLYLIYIEKWPTCKIEIVLKHKHFNIIVFRKILFVYICLIRVKCLSGGDWSFIIWLL